MPYDSLESRTGLLLEQSSPRMRASLPELIAIIGGGGLVLGGLGGFVPRPQNNREFLTNIGLGSTVGLFVGTLVAFVVYLGMLVTGG